MTVFKCFPAVYSCAFQQFILTTSLWVKQFEVNSYCFLPFEKAWAEIHLEKGTSMLCRARTLFLFNQCYSVKVSDKDQFHTTAILVVNSTTSMESSN